MIFTCPNCGKETFEAASELRAINDFKNKPCPICSYRLTEEDIKKLFTEESVKLTKETLKRAGLIK